MAPFGVQHRYTVSRPDIVCLSGYCVIENKLQVCVRQYLHILVVGTFDERYLLFFADQNDC